ncbi:nucleotide kinase domain-containing protein [Sphingomonas sp.]|uniref:nucleotide kinase domain-containing protein n=1 Tax=Sphingomonas sp. TaxID=28214 RepID=UPI003B00D364
MVPTKVFDSYWRFAAERQAILHRRLRGESSPWTNDPVLAAHRFTNAYRVADRVSQYLIREVQQREDRSHAPHELFFRTIMFKLFNRIETWEALEGWFGPLAWATADLDAISAFLSARQDRGVRNYSAAYIMPPPNLGHGRKHSNHLALLARMMTDRLPDRLRQAPSLADVYERLLNYPGLGPFLAFQYAIDLNYSELLDFDEDDFVVAGPGALDGIAKCFASTGRRTAAAVISWMVEHQDAEFERLGLSFQRLGGRRLHLIDCQNLFCEISKYARAAHPEVVGLSGRTRIKQAYRVDPRPMTPIVLPKRWQQVEPSQLNTAPARRCSLKTTGTSFRAAAADTGA